MATEVLSIESFEELDLETARSIVIGQTGPMEVSNWSYYNDNHWQDGEGWTGPKLSSNEGVAKTVLTEIERQFTWSNVARELVDHHCDAVIANPPQYGSVFIESLVESVEGQDAPTRSEEESREQGELDDLLRAWSDDSMRGLYIDRNGITRTCTIHELLQRAARLYKASGRANLRLLIPPKKRDQAGKLPAVPFVDSLKRTYFELLEPGVGAVYPDRDRMEPIGVTVYKVGGKEFAEFSYVNEAGETVLHQLSSDEKEQKTPPVPLPMEGRLWLFEMCHDPLLLGSILSQQKSLNKTLTMGDRNLDLAGFAERVIKNTQLDGEMLDDPTSPTGKRWVPKPMNFGAGSVTALRGVETVQEDGKITLSTPDYDKIEPLGNDIFDNAAERGRGRMLDQAAQTYVELEGDGQASGKSRETARQRFRNSIGGTVRAVTSAGLWLFNVAISVARATSSEQTKYQNLRVDFKCQIDLGALSALERAEDREQVKAGLMSRETAMTRGGTEDVDAENGRIESENATSLAITEQRAKAMQALSAAGAAVGSSARVAGFNDEQVMLLEKTDFAENE